MERGWIQRHRYARLTWSTLAVVLTSLAVVILGLYDQAWPGATLGWPQQFGAVFAASAAVVVGGALMFPASDEERRLRQHEVLRHSFVRTMSEVIEYAKLCARAYAETPLPVHELSAVDAPTFPPLPNAFADVVAELSEVVDWRFAGSLGALVSFLRDHCRRTTEVLDMIAQGKLGDYSEVCVMGMNDAAAVCAVATKFMLHSRAKGGEVRPPEAIDVKGYLRALFPHHSAGYFTEQDRDIDARYGPWSTWSSPARWS